MIPRGFATRALVALATTLCATLLGTATASAQTQAITATVGLGPSGPPMPQGFVGVSLEYSALHVYTGRSSNAVNPVLLDLLRGIAPSQSPVIRIGGDSSDNTWWPISRAVPPPAVRYSLTWDWLRTARALAASLKARLIMGVNLAAGRPAIAAAEARAILQGIGRSYVQAFEIGNEPDIYNLFPWYRDRRGRAVYARGPSYDMSAFTNEFTLWSQAMPAYELAGPALAKSTWTGGLDQFISSEPELGILTIHRYPLRAGVTDTKSRAYPSIRNLLSDAASSGLAQEVAPFAATTHSHGLLFRLDEMNSASNSGQRGVSNTFASALWVLDTLFNLASAGVDGVNIHSLPFARYELFSFTERSGRRHAFVHPEYYGMAMFAQAFPPGARLLPVSVPQGALKVWATRGRNGHTRVTLINKNLADRYVVTLRTPHGGPSAIEWLKAPHPSSTSGVTLGARTFGDDTTTGKLGRPQRLTVKSTGIAGGSYSIVVPPASALLLTQ